MPRGEESMEPGGTVPKSDCYLILLGSGSYFYSARHSHCRSCTEQALPGEGCPPDGYDHSRQQEGRVGALRLKLIGNKRLTFARD